MSESSGLSVALWPLPLRARLTPGSRHLRCLRGRRRMCSEVEYGSEVGRNPGRRVRKKPLSSVRLAFGQLAGQSSVGFVLLAP